MLAEQTQPLFPNWLVKLLWWFLPDGFEEEVLSDLEETYFSIVEKHGSFLAGLWFLVQIPQNFAAAIHHRIFWNFAVFADNMKMALRHLIRHRAYSLINILGLAVGLACALIILLYVDHELYYDRDIPDVDRLYRVSEHRVVPAGEFILASIEAPVAPAINENYPQVEAAGRIHSLNPGMVQNHEISSFEKNIWYADPSIFDLFGIRVLSGDPVENFGRKNTLVLTNSLRKKYFGETDPLGQTLKIRVADGFRAYEDREFEVVGLIADGTSNSHFKYSILVSMPSMWESYPRIETEWHSSGFHTYIRLKKETDAVEFSAIIKELAYKYVGADFAKWGQTRGYYLQAVQSLHIAIPLRGEMEASGTRQVLLIYKGWHR